MGDGRVERTRERARGKSRGAVQQAQQAQQVSTTGRQPLTGMDCSANEAAITATGQVEANTARGLKVMEHRSLRMAPRTVSHCMYFVFPELGTALKTRPDGTQRW